MRRHDAHKLYATQWGTACIYCDETAEVGDHAWPINAVLRGYLPRNKDMLVVVPACAECNYLASDYVFETLNEKRKFIRRKLLRKYEKFLRLPDWEQTDEVFECQNLASTIRSGLEIRDRVLRRVGQELAKSVERNLSHIVSGNDSAAHNAEISGISVRRSKQEGLGENEIEQLLARTPPDVLEHLANICSSFDDVVLALQERQI